VIERNSAGIDTHSYTHKDRLGSTVAITNEVGDVEVQQGFGPFGKARNENWEDSTNLPGTNYDSRGFTDHEHLDATRLIHMNGRAYDYNLGRFLSIDPVIQFPSNSQSLNPYSYLMNNPMAGTDPTGYMSCSADNPSGCVEAAEGLGDGESIEVKATQTGSRIAKTVGSISNNGGVISVSDNNGNVVGSTTGTTNTGSGTGAGGEGGGQGISGLGGQGQAGNQQSQSPKSQAQGINESQNSSPSSGNIFSDGKPGNVVTEFKNIKTIRDVDSALTALRKLVGDDAVVQSQVASDIRRLNLIGATMISVDISKNMILQAQISERINDNQRQALIAIGTQLSIAGGGAGLIRGSLAVSRLSPNTKAEIFGLLLDISQNILGGGSISDALDGPVSRAHGSFKPKSRGGVVIQVFKKQRSKFDDLINQLRKADSR